MPLREHSGIKAVMAVRIFPSGGDANIYPPPPKVLMTNQNLIPPKFTLENKEFIGVTYREPRWGIMGKSVGGWP